MTAKDKGKTTTGNAKNDRKPGIPWRIGAWGAAVLFLLANVVGNQISPDVNWTAGDFVFAGVLLFGALGVYEIAVRTTRNAVYRTGVGMAIMGTLLLIWINAAVGITDSVADVVYLGVPVVGLVGGVLGRFRPEGMAKALFATAVAQVLITVIALVGGMVPAYNTTVEILGINGIFVGLWVGSAWLFREAGGPGLERETA
jgi:hypothetical protein